MEASNSADLPTEQLQDMSVSDQVPTTPKNVLVHISYKCSDEEGAFIDDWEPGNFSINFEASEPEFSKVLKDELNVNLSKHQQSLDHLTQSGKELHMHPAIEFGDWRDLYLRPSPRGDFNFESISDLFFDHANNIVIPVTVMATVHSLGTEVDTFLKPNRDRYTRVGFAIPPTTNQSVTDQLPLDPARRLYLAKYTNSHSLELCAITTWFWDRRWLGDLRDKQVVNTFPQPSDFVLPSEFSKASSAIQLQESIRQKLELLASGSLGNNAFEGCIPLPPKMSFQPHESNQWPSFTTQAKYPIAIRVVNRINDEQDVGLPTIQSGLALSNDTPKDVLQSLRKSLEKSPRRKTSTFVDGLFSNEFKDKWSLDLWVMPQGGSKMRFWWSGTLAQFCQKSCVPKRDFRLYVEAHLVPVKSRGDGHGLSAKPLQDAVLTNSNGTGNDTNDIQSRGVNDPTEPEPSTTEEGDNGDDNESSRNEDGLGDEEDDPFEHHGNPEKGFAGNGYCKVAITYWFINKQHFWKPAHTKIAQEETTSILSLVVRQQVDKAIESDEDFMRDLRQNGTHAHMTYHVYFPDAKGKVDERNAYVSDDLNQVRIRHVRDLFQHTGDLKKEPTIHVRVRVEVRPGEDVKQKPQYRDHRYGTLSLSQGAEGKQETSTHFPMKRALFARYDISDPRSWRPVTTNFRKVNGVLIGRRPTAKETDAQQENTIFPAGMRLCKKYDGVLPHRLKEYINLNIRRAAQTLEYELNLPTLPVLSFLCFEPNERHMSHDDSVEEIQLAIRIEHHLHEYLGEHPLEVPTDITMKVKSGTNAVEVIHDAFLKSLQKPIPGSAGPVLDPDRELRDKFSKLWKMDFWVLPQSDTSLKLRRLKPHGIQLHEFLDKNMVKSGNTRLYMEVHLVPTYDPEVC